LPASLAEAALRLKGARGAGRAATVPACILIAERARLPDPEPAIGRLPRGSAVILRDYGALDRAAHAARLVRLCRSRRLRLLVAGDGRLAVAVGGHGLHLPERAACSGDRRWRLWRKPGWLVTAAAHSPRAAALARRAGVDALLLSPVFATASHPGAVPLGPLRFAAWARAARLPVYALGGITALTTRRLAGGGAAGIAAIGGFAP
jgi:thiamine-phosphate pyrophosphorylase